MKFRYVIQLKNRNDSALGPSSLSTYYSPTLTPPVRRPWENECTEVVITSSLVILPGRTNQNLLSLDVILKFSEIKKYQKSRIYSNNIILPNNFCFFDLSVPYILPILLESNEIFLEVEIHEEMLLPSTSTDFNF